MAKKKDENKQPITRKIQIYPVGDKEEINRVYTYIRNGMKVQSLMMNQYISALYMFCKDNKLKNLNGLKEKGLEEKFKEMNRRYSRIPNEKKGEEYSAYDLEIKELIPKGLTVQGDIPNNTKPKFDKACTDGLMYGKVSLPTYKRNYPMDITKPYVQLKSLNNKKNTGMYHTYENHNDFLDALYKNKDVNIYIDFPENIKFKVVLGLPHKSKDIRNIIKCIFEEYYMIQGSSIQFDKSGKKIMLNLSLSVPIEKRDLEDIVVGADLGLAIPCCCGINNNEHRSFYIGDSEDFLRVRTQMQNQRKRIQKALTYNSGGHGRKKKLKKLEVFKKREKNYCTTYNHNISKKVIEFALNNNAKYINIEYLKYSNFNKYILKNWSYYQLQEFIKYKARLNDIEVRYINPCYTSQVCSCCGKWHKGNRISQAKFICQNPECDNYGVEVNADWNASRNIAKSTLFINEDEERKSKEKKEDRIKRLKQEARDYYGITVEEELENVAS